jgi:cell migration-inducing and hyaluronan-binding protein
MDKGSWVIFELPGFANAAAGTEQGSLAALRNASETAYFRDENSLWVKLVVEQPLLQPIRASNTQASITLSR